MFETSFTGAKQNFTLTLISRPHPALRQVTYGGRPHAIVAPKKQFETKPWVEIFRIFWQNITLSSHTRKIRRHHTGFAIDWALQWRVSDQQRTRLSKCRPSICGKYHSTTWLDTVADVIIASHSLTNNISNGVQPSGRVILTIDRRSTS